jgi:hypothetical protein
MRKIALTSAAILLATAGFVSAQTNTTQPVPQKDSPKVEQQEKNLNKGNEENTNPNAIKGKEQAPKAMPNR